MRKAIPYERVNLQRNVKDLQLTAPYEYTNIRTNVKNIRCLTFFEHSNIRRRDEKIRLTLKNVLTYGETYKKI